MSFEHLRINTEVVEPLRTLIRNGPLNDLNGLEEQLKIVQKTLSDSMTAYQTLKPTLEKKLASELHKKNRKGTHVTDTHAPRSGRTPTKSSAEKRAERMDIWSKIEPHFQQIPTEGAVLQQYDVHSYEPQNLEPPPNVEHWTRLLNNKLRARTKVGSRFMEIPNPSYVRDDGELLVGKETQPFESPIPQMKHPNFLYGLLGSFVAIKSAERVEDQEMFEKEMLEYHAPLPTIDAHPYAALPFEQRLKAELEYLDINCSETPCNQESQCVKELMKLKKESERYAEEIAAIRNEIIGNLPLYRKQWEESRQAQREYNEALNAMTVRHQKEATTKRQKKSKRKSY